MLPSGGSDGTKVILVDVTSTSGISKHAKLRQYTPGAVGGMAEQRKAASYSRLWNLESERCLWGGRKVVDNTKQVFSPCNQQVSYRYGETERQRDREREGCGRQTAEWKSRCLDLSYPCCVHPFLFSTELKLGREGGGLLTEAIQDEIGSIDDSHTALGDQRGGDGDGPKLVVVSIGVPYMIKIIHQLVPLPSQHLSTSSTR
jgi:hypothetical protein